MIFDYLFSAVILPIITLIIIACIIRYKVGKWGALIEKEYLSILLVVPTLVMTGVTLSYTRFIDNEKERRESGMRELMQAVKFKVTLSKRNTDCDIIVFYEKTSETMTPKNIRIEIYPILSCRDKGSKNYINTRQLSMDGILIKLNKEKLEFRDNRCTVPVIIGSFKKRTDIIKYIEKWDYKWEGIAIEGYYNEVPGKLPPLNFNEQIYFEERKYDLS